MMWCGSCKKVVQTIHHCEFKTMEQANNPKNYKCQHCKKEKPAKDFYGQGARVSPYCEACNTEACRMNNYKREARADPRAFAQKLRRKEEQLNQMVKALGEVRA
jgi:5'-3' exonuclease